MRSGKTVWFWTSVEPAQFQKSTFRVLESLGIHVRLGFTVAEGDFRRRRGALGRIVLRLRMYIEHPVRMAWSVLTSAVSHQHIVTTNPFYAPLFATLTARGSRVIHLIYDTFPEALVVAGKLPKNSWMTRAIRRVVRLTLDRADANVFIGDWLQRHADALFGPIYRARVIPVGAAAGPFAAHPPRPVTGAVDVLYSGTLGKMHDVDTLIDAASLLGRRAQAINAALTFHAFGPGYRRFSERVRSTPGAGAWITLASSLPDAEWVSRMRAAHVALVTMKAGAERIVMPSKAYSALAAGQAILAVCSRESDLADLVASRDCGWVVLPGDAEGLVRALDEISAGGDVLQRKRENAFRAGHEEFSETAMAALWDRLLREEN